MSSRLLLTVFMAGFMAAQSSSIAAQNAAAAVAQVQAGHPRAIRRDVPLTNAIRRAIDAGTRNLTGQPGPNYWQLETDFTIEARLDPATQTITGTETILIHNNSPAALNDLVMRLDHNIFRGLVPRGSSFPAENTDGMVVTRLAIDGVEISLAPAAGRRGGGAPQNSVSGLEQTVARITLAKPIPAKGTARLEVAWYTKLPGGPNGRGHRMTQRRGDSLFQPTQWFPRLAKYDDMRGWDTSLYLGPSEFYNNFGKFDVKIDVPGGWIVSGTGVLQNPNQVLTATARERLATVLTSGAIVTIVSAEESGPGKSTAPGDRLVWHFVADKVNDFAWATARNFVWQATRATIPGKGPVPIHMVFQPHMAAEFAKAGQITRHALEFYSKLWTPYPFPQLTLQDGPSAGMEYPMVINSNAGAADHEAAHQWWPMMVGTNETRYGWMDEGFDQYMNILSAADTAGRPADLNGLGQRYGATSGDENEAAMMWSANDAGPMYGFQTYSKTPLMLSMLGGIVGDEAVQGAMSQYTKVWSFKHPSPWDFVFFMNSALKQDLGWFWYYWLWTTESVDGRIDKVAAAGPRTTVTVRQAGQMPSPVVLKVKFTATGPAVQASAGSTSRTVDPETAILTWPVDVWFNGSRTFDAVIQTGGRAIESITLDPMCRFADRDPNDNLWPAPSTPPAPNTRAYSCG